MKIKKNLILSVFQIIFLFWGLSIYTYADITYLSVWKSPNKEKTIYLLSDEHSPDNGQLKILENAFNHLEYNAEKIEVSYEDMFMFSYDETDSRDYILHDGDISHIWFPCPPPYTNSYLACNDGYIDLGTYQSPNKGWIFRDFAQKFILEKDYNVISFRSTDPRLYFLSAGIISKTEFKKILPLWKHLVADYKFHLQQKIYRINEMEPNERTILAPFHKKILTNYDYFIEKIIAKRLSAQEGNALNFILKVQLEEKPGPTIESWLIDLTDLESLLSILQPSTTEKRALIAGSGHIRLNIEKILTQMGFTSKKILKDQIQVEDFLKKKL